MQSEASIENKTVLITGATDGIGRVTAEQLSQQGAVVVIISRNAEKCARVAADISAKTGKKVDYLVADLSAQAEVHRVAQEFRQRYDRLHILINNAGALFMKHEVSQDGIEMTFALNHMAYFTLTNLLLDLLIASAPARIINVSSRAHTSGSLRLETVMNSHKSYNGYAAYSQSKLANVFFTHELARRLEGTGVTVNALHPGFVASNFGRSNGGLLDPLFKLVQLFAISPEEGAKTTIYLATSPEVENVSGKYFSQCKAVPSSEISYDQHLEKKLWEESSKLAGISERV